MLELVLEDLRRHRLSLCKELERAASRQSGSDYIDRWNRIDEIGEHDRRIGVLMDVIAEIAACQCCDPCNVLQATLKSVRELPLGSAAPYVRPGRSPSGRTWPEAELAEAPNERQLYRNRQGRSRAQASRRSGGLNQSLRRMTGTARVDWARVTIRSSRRAHGSVNGIARIAMLAA